jgi:predicted 3-demethylubiquinone-9 3-methyltransferase (glyoxalase superfamily)
MTKVTPFLMFNDQLEAAMEFYTATFPDSEIRNVARTGKDGPITSAEFLVGGQVFMGYNGGPYFAFSEGFSLYVDCEDQAEVDEYWDKLIKAGAKPTQCGWIKDPFGLSWQIVPRRFIELIRDKDARRRRCAPQVIPGAVESLRTIGIRLLSSRRFCSAGPSTRADRRAVARTEPLEETRASERRALLRAVFLLRA